MAYMNPTGLRSCGGANPRASTGFRFLLSASRNPRIPFSVTISVQHFRDNALETSI